MKKKEEGTYVQDLEKKGAYGKMRNSFVSFCWIVSTIAHAYSVL